jgi:CHAT domain-containing protein
LIVQVVPGGGAAQGGLRAGDVLLRYGATQLQKVDDLRPAAGPDAVAVQVWRDGRTLDLRVPPGRLGVALDRQPAAQALASRRAADATLAASLRGPGYAPLPGTRREVLALARLFPRADVLLGPAASDAQLERLATGGALGRYGVLHLATHGLVDPGEARRSALVLAHDPPDPRQPPAAGRRLRDGTVRVADILDTWQLDAELVTLSACETGLGREGGGDGLMGFSQALLLKGARSLLVSLWPVDDVATSLLMVRFYENWLGSRPGTKPLPKAEALRQAKEWLRSLTAEEVQNAVAGLPAAERGERARRPEAKGQVARPYVHPYYWSAFILIGDPN